jgi:hypothetical protein
MSTCAVEGCPREVTARGWCDAHYRRWLAYGDPLKLSALRTWDGKCRCGSTGPFYKHSRECKECREKRSSIWRKNNKAHVLAYKAASDKRCRQRQRAAVLKAYGTCCCCCGEKEEIFLVIDHKEGGGNKHRREIGRANLYKWLVKQGFPKGFQTLCHNCNYAKSHGGCPHRKKNRHVVAA